jgi:zinc protease
MPNGLTVLVREDHSAPVAAVVTYVRCGYFDETDDVSGIAHVLEHMFFKGTRRRGVGQIAQQTKACGGYLNAATIYDHTRYYAVLPSSGFEEGLEIQADAYANSIIDAAELGRELEVIIEEAKRKADTPSAVTTETLFELLHDVHRIRRWRIGREEGLRALTRDALCRFYRNFYTPSSTILVIAGDVRTGRVMQLVESLYGGLEDRPIARSPGAQERVPPGRRYREIAGDIRQTHFALGWRTRGTLDPDAPRLEIAASILGGGRASRLYRGVRNRGLATSVSAWDYTPTEIGVFVVHASGDPARTGEAIPATWRETQAVRAGVTDAELERVKRIFESRWVRQLETMEGQANHLAEWEASGDWRLGEEVLARTMAVSRAAAIDAVERHLRPDQASLLVYRPASAEPFAADADEAFSRLEAGPGAAVPPLGDTPPAGPLIRSDAPRFERAVGDVHVFRTTRDVPILVRHRRGAPIVHFGMYLLGGTLPERADQSGIANLVVRSSLQGSARRSADELALASELLGGSVAPSVTADGLGWGMSVPTTHAGEAIRLVAEVALLPEFAPAGVERERLVALSQLAQLRDDMTRLPMRLAFETAYGSHAYGRSVLGDADALGHLSSELLREWHEAHVARSTGVLALIGDIEPASAAAFLAGAFHDLRFTAPEGVQPASWSGGGQRHETRDKAQSALAMIFPGPSRAGGDRFAGRVLATIASGLGGRFFEELRDRQSLAYTVSVSMSNRLAGGHIMAYIAMSPEKEDAARQGLLAEFARFRESEVTAEELGRAKAYLLGSHAIAQQSAGTVLDEMVDAWLYGTGLEEMAETDARIAAVTAREIRDFARRHLDADLRVEGVVRGIGPGS